MTTSSSNPQSRPAADSDRSAARVAGIFYLLTFVSSIPALALLEPVLSDPDYIVGAGADTRILWGGILDLVNAAACIGTAVALFPVLRRVHETRALGFVASRIMEAAIIVIGVVGVFAVLTLRQEVGVAASADRDSLILIGRALVALRDWTFLLGPGLVPVFNALLLASALRRARLVPSAIPVIGLIGAPLLFASTMATVFGLHEQVSVTSALAAVPIALWEFSLAIRLVTKGFLTPSVADERPTGVAIG